MPPLNPKPVKAIKLFRILLTAFTTALISTAANAQITAFDMDGNTGNEATEASSTTVTGMETSTLSRGLGIVATNLAKSFNSSGFDTTSTTLAEAQTAGDFLQFALDPQAGYEMSLSTLDANFRRSIFGPDTFQYQYSLDGFASAGTSFGSEISFTSTTTKGVAQAQIDLSGISALQDTTDTVTFRLFGYGAIFGTGTYAIGRLTGDDLAIGGSVTLVPEPSSLLLLGLGSVILIARRKRS